MSSAGLQQRFSVVKDVQESWCSQAGLVWLLPRHLPADCGGGSRFQTRPASEVLPCPSLTWGCSHGLPRAPETPGLADLVKPAHVGAPGIGLDSRDRLLHPQSPPGHWNKPGLVLSKWTYPPGVLPRCLPLRKDARSSEIREQNAEDYKRKRLRRASGLPVSSLTVCTSSEPALWALPGEAAGTPPVLPER